jgi:hypothetical protein
MSSTHPQTDENRNQTLAEKHEDKTQTPRARKKNEKKKKKKKKKNVTNQI